MENVKKEYYEISLKFNIQFIVCCVIQNKDRNQKYFILLFL